jgi:hypothetical protein
VTLVGSVGAEVRVNETFPVTGIPVTVGTDVPQLGSLGFTTDPVSLTIVPPSTAYGGVTRLENVRFSLTGVGRTPITLVGAATEE